MECRKNQTANSTMHGPSLSLPPPLYSHKLNILGRPSAPLRSATVKVNKIEGKLLSPAMAAWGEEVLAEGWNSFTDFCGRQRAAVDRYRIICLVLILICRTFEPILMGSGVGRCSKLFASTALSMETPHFNNYTSLCSPKNAYMYRILYLHVYSLHRRTNRVRSAQGTCAPLPPPPTNLQSKRLICANELKLRNCVH